MTVATVPASPEGRAVARALPAQDAIALAGRVLIAVIFVMAGAGKVAQPGATIAHMVAAGLPLAPVGLVGAVAIELGAGIALILGYRTRIAAAVLALFSLVTALIFHTAFSDQNQFINFFKNVAVAGGLLQVVAFGGGRLSLDARLGRRVK